MIGICAIGAYLPQARLQRAAMADAMGWLTPGLPRQGSRAMAFWDEDSTTMAVEAGRFALKGVEDAPRQLDFCTTTPAFAERQNAAIAHAALRLPTDCTTQEIGSTPLAGLTALHRQMESGTPALVLCADRPINAPGSLAETRSGDGASALLTGLDPALTYLGGTSVTDPFTDRYRVPGAPFAIDWEERWVRETGWQTLVADTIRTALSSAHINTPDHLVAASPIPRLGSALAKAAGLSETRIADDLSAEIGYTASAHPFLTLAAHLPHITPGETVLMAGLGQGATVLIFRATDSIGTLDTGFAASRDAGHRETVYTKLPVFSGVLPYDQGQRGKTPVMEALTTAHRYAPAILSFTGGRCTETDMVQFPPSRISSNQSAHLTDTQEPWPLAHREGIVATHTADALAFSRMPPACYGLVDFDGGGRLMMYFTDANAADIKVGDRVRFVFRIKDIDANTGYRRYFWKAVPTRQVHDA